MAGIYIHIPFCKQACNYCDFHFSTQLKNKSRLIQAIIKEIDLRKDYLEIRNISSIYFGGGTPSLLNQNEITAILEKIYACFSLNSELEICLEANPDDLTKEKLNALSKTAINRLSIGVQSFHDEELKFMNRAHNAIESINSIKTAQDIGFGNLNVDLIFGSPKSTLKSWEENLKLFFSLNIPHLSAYSLTVEEGTQLAHAIKNKKIAALDDDLGYKQYKLLQAYIDKKEYEQYEISNYCKNGKRAIHNSNYWNQSTYLGIGPSAHSFNGKSRQWNISNNPLYLKSIEKNHLPFEKEELSETEIYHDYLITSLRTREGLSLKKIHEIFSYDIVKHFLKAKKELPEELVNETSDRIFLKREKLFQSDEAIRILW